MTNKWIVNVKGNHNSGEISIVRDNNSHGKRSYGWFGDDKILVFSSGGPCQDKTTTRIFAKLIELAKEEAELMNEEEAK